jgi:hypothetical protein
MNYFFERVLLILLSDVELMAIRSYVKKKNLQ